MLLGCRASGWEAAGVAANSLDLAGCRGTPLDFSRLSRQAPCTQRPRLAACHYCSLAPACMHAQKLVPSRTLVDMYRACGRNSPLPSCLASISSAAAAVAATLLAGSWRRWRRRPQSRQRSKSRRGRRRLCSSWSSSCERPGSQRRSSLPSCRTQQRRSCSWRGWRRTEAVGPAAEELQLVRVASH